MHGRCMFTKLLSAFVKSKTQTIKKKKKVIYTQCNVANYIVIINMVILVNNTAFVFLVINSFLPDLANQPTPQKYNVKI